MTNYENTALSNLFCCYFHQDWYDEYGSDIGAIQAIRVDESSERIADAVCQIEEILALPLSESELHEIVLNQLGCYLAPSYLGLDYRQWLNRARLLLQQA